MRNVELRVRVKYAILVPVNKDNFPHLRNLARAESSEIFYLGFSSTKLSGLSKPKLMYKFVKK